MSESLKKLKKEGENPPKRNDKVKGFLERKSPELLERQAEVARRKEEQIKREREKARKEYELYLRKILESSTRLIRRLTEDEVSASQEYTTLARHYRDLGVPTIADVFMEIANEESRHVDKLQKLKTDLKIELDKKLTELA